MGSTFVEDTQPTLIGALWYRENEFIGAGADTDGDGETESYPGPLGHLLRGADERPCWRPPRPPLPTKIMLRTTAEEPDRRWIRPV